MSSRTSISRSSIGLSYLGELEERQVAQNRLAIYGLVAEAGILLLLLTVVRTHALGTAVLPNAGYGSESAA